MGQGKSKKGEAGVAQSTTAASNGALEYIKSHYDEYFGGKEIKTFDEFYHAIFEFIEKLSVHKGSMQLKIPSKQKLKDIFDKNRGFLREGKPLSKEEFEKIITSIIDLDSFYIGQGARDVLLFILGAPACILLAKRFIPGLKSISDDIVIPAATSGSVIILTMTNKL